MRETSQDPSSHLGANLTALERKVVSVSPQGRQSQESLEMYDVSLQLSGGRPVPDP